MIKKYKLLAFVLLGISIVAMFAFLLRDSVIDVLAPQGVIAQRQRNLIVFTTLLGLLVVVPVFLMTFLFAWKYRASNKKARYMPWFDGSKKLELTWWAVPGVIIFVLSIITWRTSHELDPFKPLDAKAQPITIQVTALQWKWLFIYPKQDIATVNYVQFPVNTPVNFEITADAPMNSFWIPRLAGQVYAMAGMKTKLHVMASETGEFRGSSANLSGKGFSDMKFIASSTSQDNFNKWIQTVKNSGKFLDLDSYNKLTQPATSKKTYYWPVEDGLYDNIVMKYMMPPAEVGNSHSHETRTN